MSGQEEDRAYGPGSSYAGVVGGLLACVCMNVVASIAVYVIMF